MVKNRIRRWLSALTAGAAANAAGNPILCSNVLTEAMLELGPAGRALTW